MAEDTTATARGAQITSPDAGDEKIAIDLAAHPAKPVAKSGTWQQVLALCSYMTRTEVHTYAFSVAAQVILALFPFIVLLLMLSSKVFHSEKMTMVVGEMMTNFLPNHQAFVMRNMQVLADSHATVRIYSVIVLFVTTSGVFLPLEVALNSVWGVKKNRSYLANQFVSLGLAIGVALLALASIALTTAQRTVMAWVFFGHTNNIVFDDIGRTFLQLCALAASIGIFFLIYWGLPHRKVPVRAVLPTAIVMGVLWTVAKYIYIVVLPHLDFHSVYGAFDVSVSLITWAFISGLMLLAGAYVSATRQALREADEDDLKQK